jgi:hypothetical protein
MIAATLLVFLLGGATPIVKGPETPQKKTQDQAKAPPSAETDDEDLPPEEETLAELAKVRRIYVDVLTGGDSALRIRDLLMSRIQASKLFIVTEEEERADAVLKGSGSDDTFTDVFQSSDNINVHSQLSVPTLGNNNNNSTNGTSSRYSDRMSSSIGAGESENHKIEERKHEAIATVRLVNKDGDVIWSATEESLGAKFMGASVDVVDRITKKLAADYRKAKVESKGTAVAPPK